MSRLSRVSKDSTIWGISAIRLSLIWPSKRPLLSKFKQKISIWEASFKSKPIRAANTQLTPNTSRFSTISWFMRRESFRRNSLSLKRKEAPSCYPSRVKTLVNACKSPIERPVEWLRRWRVASRVLQCLVNNLRKCWFAMRRCQRVWLRGMMLYWLPRDRSILLKRQSIRSRRRANSSRL